MARFRTGPTPTWDEEGPGLQAAQLMVRSASSGTEVSPNLTLKEEGGGKSQTSAKRAPLADFFFPSIISKCSQLCLSIDFPSFLMCCFLLKILCSFAKLPLEAAEKVQEVSGGKR